jgi:ABC-type polysaccharide/polyol phosphate export permease
METHRHQRHKITEFLRYKELIRNLVIRDLKVRYKRSILGVFWAFLEPLFLMILFTVVFSIVLRIKVENYPIFLLCGLLPWKFFSSSLSYSSTSIAQHANLIKKIYFPREIFPLGVIFARLVNFLITLGLLFLFLLAFKVRFTPYILFLPLIILLQIFLVVGLSFFFTSLNTFYDDVGFILEFILFGWFYLTPIFYPTTMVPERFLSLYMLNPMAVIVNSYRNVLLYGQGPDVGQLMTAMPAIALALVIGWAVFRRLENRFAEVL